MKKMLFMAVLVIGGGWFVKNNLVVAPDGQVRLAGWMVPVPPSVQSSPVYGMVMMMVRMQTSGQPAAVAAAQPARPAMPTVTSATATYNANAPAAAPAGAGPAGASEQFSAVSKVLRGQ